MIRTKLFIPRLTADHVKREGLIRKLEYADDYHLTLVAAPAGYGKSTIVASWLDQQSTPAAWLSLDENDKVFFLFLKYLIKSIRMKFNTFGSDLLQLLDSSEQPASDVLIGEVMNHLSGLNESLILVIDDFHYIRDKNILSFIKEFVSHPPPEVSLILLSRSDPDLPLHTLRLSGTKDAYIDHILTRFNQAKAKNGTNKLSDREQQILLYLSDRLSNKEIGAKLFISEKTVKNHLNSIYRKLGANGRRDAISKARTGMLL